MTMLKGTAFGAATLGALLLATSLIHTTGNQAEGAFAGLPLNGGRPVPEIDAEQLARIPYQSAATNSGCVGLVGSCTFLFTPAPAGYRLVVENLSGWFQLSGPASAPPIVLLKDASSRTALGFAGTVGPLFGGSAYAAINQPTRAYFDPSDGNITASVTASFPAASLPQRMTLTGHLENCSITGCPAIQR
jgi:hypothetical protein